MGIYSSLFDVAYNSIILLSLGKKGTVFSGDGILLIIIIDTANVRVLEVKVGMIKFVCFWFSDFGFKILKSNHIFIYVSLYRRSCTAAVCDYQIGFSVKSFFFNALHSSRRF